MQKKNWLITLAMAVAVALVFLLGFFVLPKFFAKTTSSPDTSLTAPSPMTNNFSPYAEVTVGVTPKVPAYNLAESYRKATNAFSGALSKEEEVLLKKYGFVVRPSYEEEFFSIYEQNFYDTLPNFITVDSILHTYHLAFNHLLETLETEKLIPQLKTLNKNMLAAALEQYEKLKGSSFENAAKRNVAFFTVGSSLLDPTIKIPEIVKNETESELALIKGHRGAAPSPVINLGTDKNKNADLPFEEDYSQYVPRGHYTKTSALSQYFNSMLWYGRLTFRFSKEDETKSALLITLALNSSTNLKIWEALYEPTCFFVGKTDDVDYYQFNQLVKQIYASNQDLSSMLKAKNKFNDLWAAAQKCSPPEINSIPIFNKQIQPDREGAIKGFRFMGQRFTIDAAIMQKLVYRDVGANPAGKLRMLPKGLDIPAAMGNDEALKILESMGETKYKNYSENLSKLRTYLKSIPVSAWTQNLYWGWLYTLQPLLKEKPAGYPEFMRTAAWARKELNSFLGSWTELKHDTILYTKQVYAEMGGAPPEENDDRGYVEPNPYVYARLASLVQMTKAGLQARQFLNETSAKTLTIMEELCLKLKTIAEKELNNQPLSDADYELIRSYGGQLEHLWLEINKKDFEAMGIAPHDFLMKNPAALVADVATDPNGIVLEEANGKISAIYVVVPFAGKFKVTKGGVFSYHEFTWPMSDRLTNQSWINMLTEGKKPPQPDWTKMFIAE